MATNTIYVIHNTVNNKKYVGQTWTSLKRRWRSGYDNSTHLHRAIQKYGTKSFYYETLALCSDQETADYLEEYYIELLDTRNDAHGYNLRAGGENKFRHSPQTIKRMSDSATQTKLNAEAVVRMRKEFSDGLSFLILSEKYGVSSSTVQDAVHGRTWRHVPGACAAQTKRRPNKGYKITPALKKEILRLRDQGYTYDAITDMIGVASRSTIRNVIKGYVWKD